MLLVQLAITINPITVALATMVVEWWVANGLEVVSSPQYSVVWHDLWCHVLQGADVSLVGETRAQVVQLGGGATTTSLVQYWSEVYGRELPVHTAQELLLEVAPYATSVVEDYTFTMEVAKEVSKCIAYLLYYDPF